MIDLSIVIVSYNTKEFLKKCLDAIERSTTKSISYEVIVVDNASTDDSIDIVNNLTWQTKQCTLIRNEKNLGFSKGNNIGVKKAKGRYVLFLNSDTEIYANTLLEIIKFMDEHTDAGAATCKVVLPNGHIDDASHRGFPTPWNAFSHFSGLSKILPASRLFSGYSLGWMDKDVTHEIDACAGAFMMVRKEAGESIRWWDEDFFFYGEDLDFCYKLKQKGWKIYYVPKVAVLHYKGVSAGIKEISRDITKADETTKTLATRARFDAMRIFYKKHYIEKYPKILTWSVLQAINIKEWLALRSV